MPLKFSRGVALWCVIPAVLFALIWRMARKLPAAPPASPSLVSLGSATASPITAPTPVETPTPEPMHPITNWKSSPAVVTSAQWKAVPLNDDELRGDSDVAFSYETRVASRWPLPQGMTHSAHNWYNYHSTKLELLRNGKWETYKAATPAEELNGYNSFMFEFSCLPPTQSANQGVKTISHTRGRIAIHLPLLPVGTKRIRLTSQVAYLAHYDGHWPDDLPLPKGIRQNIRTYDNNKPELIEQLPDSKPFTIEFNGPFRTKKL